MKLKYLAVLLLALAELTTGALRHFITEQTFVGDLVIALSDHHAGDRNGLNP